ncbi:MAG: TolC family protein [Ignavibacteria bacterium]|nr:TolC family protein [Ignavibacteria bacterium]
MYLGAGYNLANPNSRIQPQVNRFDGTWDAGIFLSWDFWNWGSTSAQVIQNEQTLIQGKLSRAQLMEAIELEVNQNYLNLNFLKEKAEVSNLTTGQSEENYRVIREKYNAQLATSTELADAETLLFQAKTNYANAVADYRIALIKLYKSAGRKLYP